MNNSKPILVTGATGYVGGRLIPRLLEADYRIRAVGRSLAKIRSRPWSRDERVDVWEGDVLDRDFLERAANGCRAAYYLVHSMGTSFKDFEELDRRAAQNMAHAAEKGSLEKIIYLGGLGDDRYGPLSRHLRSRHETAQILQSGKVPTTFLRAAMILGSGSASFEILRYIIDRLPVLLTPKWVDTPCQPIAIRNVLRYLIGCLESDETTGQTFDIGGPDILNYRQLMHIYAEEAGLPRRLIIPVPVMAPALSAYWIHMISPLPSSIVIPLAKGLKNPVICRDNRIRDMIPQNLLSCEVAIRLALARIQQELVETRWSDAGSVMPPEWSYCGDADYAGGTILECCYRVRMETTPEKVWEPISRIGGQNGWYFGNFLWRIRGEWDRLTGGIGLRRGRRHPSELYVGDALDFWRVLEVEPNQRLLLHAEMKLPGDALLEFRIQPTENGETELQILSRFLPKGLYGICYWYALYPFHHWIFGGMLTSISKIINRKITEGPVHFKSATYAGCYLNPEAKNGDTP